ncbi:MAG TPA: CRISPR system precrRNA processing endoribonuclease RAMP protein Cas6 [Geopsychrobacteraceae bacterium]|nr:CRISPR system precrRNA processing endoribonuclease RAMP protein Cas6 [Geopsychrobacteraceae bacterium]
MSNLFPIPDYLESAEYSLLIFHLQAKEYFDLPLFGLLRLRREFQQAIQRIRGSVEDELFQQLHSLLEPSPPNDIRLRRLVQKPSPAIVLFPDLGRSGLTEPGDCISLPVLFLGQGLLSIEPFACLLRQVGKQGLLGGQGVCELSAIEAEDASGQRTVLWDGGAIAGTLSPVINDLRWWLDMQPLNWNRLRLDFVSPTRLLHGGKPLFKAKFTDLFPFILRRVTAMLAAHCRLDTVNDPSAMLAVASNMEESDNCLQWKDWRPLTAARGGQDLGGLSGSLVLTGSGLADILWVLQLGSLLQIGKGAPYGAGRYELSYIAS